MRRPNAKGLAAHLTVNFVNHINHFVAGIQHIERPMLLVIVN